MAMADLPLLTLGFADNNAKVGTVSFPLDVAIDYDTAESAVQAAVVGIVNGTLKEHGVYDRTVDRNRLIGIKASDKSHKWRIYVRDTVTGKIDTYAVPTANYLLRADDSDQLDKTTAAYAALKTAIETHTVSSDGNPVVLFDVMYEA